MTFDDELHALGVHVEHFFGDQEYAKKTQIPAGVRLTQHQHSFAHLSIVAGGRVTLEVDGQVSEHGPGDCLLIPAGKAHSVVALTDATWFCLHGTQEKDIARIDAVLIQ